MGSYMHACVCLSAYVCVHVRIHMCVHVCALQKTKHVQSHPQNKTFALQISMVKAQDM